MKKLSFIIGLSVIALASCSSDDVVDKSSGGAVNQSAPIGFAVNTPNMGRDGAGLETVRYDFGVYAYKGDTFAAVTGAAAANTVMENYLVGYYDTTNKWGYNPLDNQFDNTDGSLWYYEGLGYDQTNTAYEWKAGGKQAAASTSVNDVQYLKYWDLSKSYTYFMACAPYNVAQYKNDATGVYYQFPLIDESVEGYDQYMYAAKRASNASHADVDLKFQRLASQIRVAFYEQIEGYEVSLIDFSVENTGVKMIPADVNTPSYDAGQYLAKATPKVYFIESATAADGIAASVSYNIPSDGWATSPIVYGIDTFKDKTGTSSVILGDGTTTEGVRDLLMGPKRAVIPSDADNLNSGFTLSVNFQLRALDTNEIINVYGAKVYVPNTAATPNFVWEPNHLYTYIFKITKNIKGSTDPDDPDPDDPTPDPDDALYPIIFDNVTIDNYVEEVKGEWNIN